MNTELQIPRIILGDDLTTICGNREGLLELQEKIAALLASGNQTIELSTDFIDEDLRRITLLNSDLIEPDYEDSSWPLKAVLIFLIIISSLIIGAFQILTWIISLFI